MRVRETYDNGGTERGQRSKQGIMEEENKQSSRRPKYDGQARGREEELSTGSEHSVQHVNTSSRSTLLYTCHGA